MTIYYALLLFAIFLAATTSFDRRFRSLMRAYGPFVFVFLWAFVGFRYGSVDYGGYRYIYETSSLRFFSFPFYTRVGDTTGNEFIFATVASFFNDQDVPFTAFLFLIAGVSIGIKFHFYRKLSPWFYLTLLIFFSVMFFKELGQIRNALASAILLFTLKPVRERRLFQFLFIVLLAFGVHAFSLIALPFYWFFPTVKYRKLTYTVIGIAILVAVSGGVVSIFLHAIPPSYFRSVRILRAVMNYYQGDRNFPMYFHAFNVTNTILAFLFVRYQKGLDTFHPDISPLIAFFVYAVIVYLFAFDFAPIAGRVAELIGLNAVAIILPGLVRLFPVRDRVVPVGLILAYSSLLFIATVQGASPYQMVFVQ